jgi:hypothetical protein
LARYKVPFAEIREFDLIEAGGEAALHSCSHDLHRLQPEKEARGKIGQLQRLNFSQSL